MYNTLLHQKLEALKQAQPVPHLYNLGPLMWPLPSARLADGSQSPVVMWCSNDYLGMSQHSKVRSAMHEALDAYGAGSGGSRNIGGSHALYGQLEQSLADWHGKEAALVFPTGFGSNDATLQCLLRELPDCV